SRRRHTRSKRGWSSDVCSSDLGATITLSSTPYSGKELRKNIKQQCIEWKTALEKLKTNSLRLKGQISQTSKEGAILMKELTQDMKSSVSQWKNTVEPH